MTRGNLCWAAALFVLGAARVLWLGASGVEQLVQFVPDDAFYYVEIARHLAAGDGFTFDGHNPASGFHPLHSGLMATVFWVAPSIELPALFVVFGLLAVAATSLAFFVLAQRTRALGLLWVFGGVAVFEMHSHLMETPWVVLAGALVLARLGRESAGLVVSVSLGLVGSLARTDFVGLPLVLVGVAVVARWFGRRANLRVAVHVAIGAVLGFGLAAGLSHWIGGSWLSASAQMKAHWGFVLGDATQWILAFASAALGGCFVPGVEDLWVAALGSGLFALVAWRVSGERWLAVAMMLTGVGYLLVYRRLGGLQSWYVGAFVVPIAWLAGQASAALWSWAKVLRVAMLVGVAVMAGCACYRSLTPRYPGQAVLWRWAVQLDDHPALPADAAVGSWNAGILGHFSERRVVNLDGLVNDAAVPWIVRGELFDFVDRQGIRWIVDNPNMLSTPWLAARGGYSVEEAGRRTRRIETDESSPADRALSVPVFEVVPR